jgi:hypothetical protein
LNHFLKHENASPVLINHRSWARVHEKQLAHVKTSFVAYKPGGDYQAQTFSKPIVVGRCWLAVDNSERNSHSVPSIFCWLSTFSKPHTCGNKPQAAAASKEALYFGVYGPMPH